jgi:hypothetical protein
MPIQHTMINSVGPNLNIIASYTGMRIASPVSGNAVRIYYKTTCPLAPRSGETVDRSLTIC